MPEIPRAKTWDGQHRPPSVAQPVKNKHQNLFPVYHLPADVIIEWLGRKFPEEKPIEVELFKDKWRFDLCRMLTNDEENQLAEYRDRKYDEQTLHTGRPDSVEPTG